MRKHILSSRTLALVAAAALAWPAALRAQELTVEAIYQTDDFIPDLVSVEWLDDGRSYTIVERGDHGYTDLYLVDTRSGQRNLLVRGADLVPPGAETPIRIESYELSADRPKLLIAANVEEIWRRSSRADFYVWDLETRTLTPVTEGAGKQMYAKLSPGGSLAAFVRDHDIYVTDLVSGAEKALTEDGGEDILNGMADWVYEEELGLADAFRWSPDGQRIAFWRFDQSPIRPFYLMDQMTLYPELIPARYPKAGTANSEVRLGVVDVVTGATVWIDEGPDMGETYIARMDFLGPDEIWFQRLNRHQNKMELRIADVATGESRLVMTDGDEAWLFAEDVIWIDGGERFVCLSERHGWAQLFLYERDGDLVRKLTDGAWDVLEVHGVDEDAGMVYFTSAADGPLYRPLYRVSLAGGRPERLTGRTGTHRVSFDPTFAYYVDIYSEAGLPPVQTLRRVDGRELRVLSDNAELRDRLVSLSLTPPEFITVPAANGMELNAWLIKPPDFDPSRSYPLLMYVYGGPGSQTVTDSWGGDRYLWHQLLARRGYLVASVDNRGTGARGSRFKKMVYLNLGKVESADQISAARYLADLPYVDETRIGIWGWSYGGYLASLTKFKGGDVFTAAVAVAPVTDWRLYDTIYTERYMRTPQENPEGYEESAPLNYADRLEGEFLLIHGTGDDNVHVQNSIRLIQRLEDANRQFHLRLYPNKAHGISGGVTRTNLFEYLTEFVTSHL